jgi:hypothetical protein
MSRTLVIRQATSRDLPKVLHFYAQHSHPNLKARGDEAMIQAAREDRKLVLVLDGSEVVGAAATFEHLDGDYHEAGAARIIINGYGLQKVLVWARTIHTFLMDPPRGEYFSVVRDTEGADAQRSKTALLKCGFEPWSDVPAEVRALKQPGRAFFRLPREALVEHAKDLLDVRGAHRTSSTGQSPIQLDLQLESINYYRDAVERISRGDLTCLGEAQAPP